jgi:hypothetical protein
VRPSIRTLVAAAAAAAALTAGSASAQPIPPPPSCPNGERPCVYLRGGTYTLGNPVTYYTASGPSSVVLLNHCDSNGTNCEKLTLQLVGYAISSTPGTILTLTIPGEGVGLSGTTPTLYLGGPQAGIGSAEAGISLTVSGTAFVIWDSSLNNLVEFACSQINIPPIFGGTPSVSGTFSPCYYSFTVSV